MTPAEIIEQLAVDGVNLALSSADTITATGNQAAVDKWLPVIRENKPGIHCELERERRRAKVMSMLEGKRFALYVDDDKTDPIIATAVIRSLATFELAIPRHSYDSTALLALIEKLYGENHAST